MRLLKIILVFCSIILLHFESCQSKQISIIDLKQDSTTSTIHVSLKELVANYKTFDLKYIQVRGRFAFNFEDVALYDPRLFSSNGLGFWLNFDGAIINNKNEEILKKLSGKEVIIKGQVNSSDKGHLNRYVAAIDNVYFIKED